MTRSMTAAPASSIGDTVQKDSCHSRYSAFGMQPRIPQSCAFSLRWNLARRGSNPGRTLRAARTGSACPVRAGLGQPVGSI
jgi:hypothetical protein